MFQQFTNVKLQNGTTYLTRDTQVHSTYLLTYLNVTDATVQQRVKMLAGGFQLKGMTMDVAIQSIEKLLDRFVNIQSTVLSYMDVFLWIGVMFWGEYF